MSFVRKKVRYVDEDTMRDILADCRNKIVIERPYDRCAKGDKMEGCCYIEDKVIELRVSTKYKGENATYIFYKDGRDWTGGINGLNAFMTLNKYWKVPRLPKAQVEYLCKNGYSAVPLLDYNPKYEGERINNCYCYDLNSAYSAAMLKGWIDASVPPVEKVINGFNEVGFRFNDNGQLEIQERGYCPFVFRLMETPEGIKRFVAHYYEMKKEAKTKEEKLKAKQMLNFCIGYLQKVNPWLRAWVVCSCNKYVEELLDDDSLFWNTDSITSRVRRLDLEKNLGIEIGQWKLEHEGSVAYKGCNYQWNSEVPTYRGIPKTWFKEGWDILKDPTPMNGNLFRLNIDTLELEVNYSNEESE